MGCDGALAPGKAWTLLDELLANVAIRVLLRMLSGPSELGPVLLAGLQVTFGADLPLPALPSKLVPPRLLPPKLRSMSLESGRWNRADFADGGAFAVDGAATEDVEGEARLTATAHCKPERPIPTLRASTLSANANKLVALASVCFVGEGEPEADASLVLAGVFATTAFAALDLVGFANDDILLGDATGFVGEPPSTVFGRHHYRIGNSTARHESTVTVLHLLD
ncbi:hypothetical protein B0H14DRAFT_3436024 [Mycena olivaceomarginata]|nr:hypothetical protein B0H14DRAFT_3545309 [Mycena olivaceomarginata]KAJ7877576.1 hypothetical protein B0H14DRAFT_3436024 [Mycena olivaceomarginata]